MGKIHRKTLQNGLVYCYFPLYKRNILMHTLKYHGTLFIFPVYQKYTQKHFKRLHTPSYTFIFRCIEGIHLDTPQNTIPHLSLSLYTKIHTPKTLKNSLVHPPTLCFFYCTKNYDSETLRKSLIASSLIPHSSIKERYTH